MVLNSDLVLPRAGSPSQLAVTSRCHRHIICAEIQVLNESAGQCPIWGGFPVPYFVLPVHALNAVTSSLSGFPAVRHPREDAQTPPASLALSLGCRARKQRNAEHLM